MKNTPQSNYESFDITKYTPWINLLSKNNNIQINIDNSFSHTAAINLQDLSKPQIILNLRLMKEKYNYSDDEIMFDIGHELGHLDEETQLQSTQTWKDIAQQRVQRLEEKWNLAESYHILENVLRDVWDNNDLISPRKLPVLKNTCYTNYRDKMFKETDYRQLPKHMQFANTIIREAMVSDQQCTIDPNVRKIISRLKRSDVLSQAISWTLQSRLQTIRQYVEPVYQKLLQDDIKNQEKEDKNQEKNNKNQKGNQNKWKGNPSQNNTQGEWNQSNSDQESWENPNSQPPQTPKWKNKKWMINELMQILWWEKNKWWNSQPPEDSQIKPSDTIPNEGKNPFDDLYQNMPKVPHLLEQELSDEDKQKLRQVLQDIYDEKNKEKTREELELEKRAKNMWINPSDKDTFQETIRKLKDYDRFLAQLEQLIDKHTGNTVMQEIENIFQCIRSHRSKPRYKSKGPVDIDHGYRLHPWAIAWGIAEVKWGNFNPEMFETDIKHEKPEQLTGRFELTLIADGSWSMNQNDKSRQQKIAVLLILEALKRLHDKLSEEKHNLTEGVEFTTQAIMFLEKLKWVLDCKDLWPDFSDQERLYTYSSLDHANWWTNDYDGLQKVIDHMKWYSHEHLQEIQSWKTKKIIIVMSDGWSDDATKMKEKIKILRNMWVLVYGVGVTSSGSPIVDLFQSTNQSLGYGQVCEDVGNLAQTLKDILWMHLEKL